MRRLAWTTVGLLGVVGLVACGDDTEGTGGSGQGGAGGGATTTTSTSSSDGGGGSTSDGGGGSTSEGGGGEGGAGGGSQASAWVRWADQGTFENAVAVAETSDGGVVGVVTLFGASDFGGGTLTAMGRDFVVFKYAADGAHVYSKRFGASGSDRAVSMAIGPNDEIYIAGGTSGTVDFVNSTTNGMGGEQAFLLKLDADANVEWSKSWGGSGNQDQTTAVGVNAAGRIVVAGFFGGSVDFGGGQLVSSGVDLFMAAFEQDGTHVYSRKVSSTSEPNNAFAEGAFNDVAVDDDDNAYFVGGYFGTLDLGVSSLGEGDGLIVKLDELGAVAWTKSIGSSQPYEGFTAVGLDGLGNLVVGGGMVGAVDLGGGTLSAGGNADPVVARFAPDGTHLSSRRFGDAGDEQLRTLAVRDDGWVLVGGSGSGNLVFDGLNLALASTGQAAYWFVLDETNTGVAGAVYEHDDPMAFSSTYVTGVSFAGSDGIYFTGDYGKATTIEGVTLPGTDDSSVFWGWRAITP